MRRVLLAAAVITAMVGPAAAQISIEPAVPATLEQVTAAYAEADRLINEADGGAFFDNVSEGDEPRARHRLSGLVCRFELGHPENEISIFPSPVTRGDDVGCNVGRGERSRTLYATRYGAFNISPEQAFEMGVFAIQQWHPDARPFDQPLATASRNGATPTRIAGFLVADGYTQVQVAHVGDWSIKERLTQPQPPAMEEQLFNGMFWSIALGEVVEAQGD